MSDSAIIKDCLVHYDSRHIQLRRDYLALCVYDKDKFNQSTTRNGKRVKDEPNQECMAKILRLLETLTDDRRKEWFMRANDAKQKGLQPPPEPKEIYIGLTYGGICHLLYDTYGESTVRNSVAELLDRKFIKRRQKTNNSIPEYAINIQVLQAALNKQAEDVLNGVSKSTAIPKVKRRKAGVEIDSQATAFDSQTDAFDSQATAFDTNNKYSNKGDNKPSEKEENAHVSDDNAPTPSLSESNSPSSLFSQYDLLLAYRDNQLEHLYECEKAAMVNMSKKLSPNRAGELAAAKLSVQFCEQYVRFKDEIDNLARTPSQQVTPEDEALYDWLVDHWNVRSDLTTLSGTRTLILDEDMYRSSLQETIEESTPAPSDEQSSKQESSSSDSQSSTSPSQQDSAKQAPSEQVEQPELIERPKKPVMPPESMKWNAEKLVQISEALRGRYFTAKQRVGELKAAKKILDEEILEVQYVRAFCDRNDTWWRENVGLLNVTDMAATPKDKSVMRAVGIWQKLEAREEAAAQKQGTLKEQRDQAGAKVATHVGANIAPDGTESYRITVDPNRTFNGGLKYLSVPPMPKPEQQRGA